VDDPRLSCTCCHARSARGSAERLGLREGSAVTVVIKSTNVLLATDQA
jgi:molybdopterin-binding protein